MWNFHSNQKEDKNSFPTTLRTPNSEHQRRSYGDLKLEAELEHMLKKRVFHNDKG